MQKRLLEKRPVKIAVIIFLVFSVIVVGGWVLLRSYIRPPAIPDAEIVSAPIETPTLEDETAITSEQGAEMPQLGLAESRERKPDFYTFLIFGLDEMFNADSIMVAAYDGAAEQAYIISIPRDTRVDAERPVGLRKIVAAYPSGMRDGDGHADGVEQLKQEVQTLIGFRPDFYIRIDDAAFINIIDAVGGVEIDVPFHMQYDDPDQGLHIDIPAGLQFLDGENALQFVSYRLGNDRRYSITDHQRIRHQHQLLSALFQELLSPRSILQIPMLIRTYHNHVGSNMTLGNKLWFGEQIYRVGDMDAIAIYTIPISGSSGAPGWYELPDVPRLLELINRTINPFVQDITGDMLRIAP